MTNEQLADKVRQHYLLAVTWFHCLPYFEADKQMLQATLSQLTEESKEITGIIQSDPKLKDLPELQRLLRDPFNDSAKPNNIIDFISYIYGFEDFLKTLLVTLFETPEYLDKGKFPLEGVWGLLHDSLRTHVLPLVDAALAHNLVYVVIADLAGKLRVMVEDKSPCCNPIEVLYCHSIIWTLERPIPGIKEALERQNTSTDDLVEGLKQCIAFQNNLANTPVWDGAEKCFYLYLKTKLKKASDALAVMLDEIIYSLAKEDTAAKNLKGISMEIRANIFKMMGTDEFLQAITPTGGAPAAVQGAPVIPPSPAMPAQPAELKMFTSPGQAAPGAATQPVTPEATAEPTALEVTAATATGDTSKDVQNLPQFVFLKVGGCWKIVYQGKEAIIENCDGLFYIYYLLGQPNKPVSCNVLYAEKKIITKPKVIPELVLDKEASQDCDKEYSELIIQIEKAIADNDVAERARLTSEMLDIKSHIDKAKRPDGKPRVIECQHRSKSVANSPV
jgi:hypothetical protein